MTTWKNYFTGLLDYAHNAQLLGIRCLLEIEVEEIDIGIQGLLEALQKLIRFLLSGQEKKDHITSSFPVFYQAIKS